MIKNNKLLTLLFFIIFYIFYLFLRGIDGDEGGYMTTMWETAQGKIPTIDIYGHNLPLFYYIYGYWMKLFGYNFISARFLSVLLHLIFGCLFLHILKKLKISNWLLIIIFCLFILHPYMIYLGTGVRQYSLSNLFLIISFILLLFYWKNTASLKDLFVIFLTGLSIGISFHGRLIITFIFSIPIWILAINKMRKIKFGWKLILGNTLLFEVGVLIGLLPAILIFYISPIKAIAQWGIQPIINFLPIGGDALKLDFLSNMVYSKQDILLSYISRLKMVLFPTILVPFLISVVGLFFFCKNYKSFTDNRITEDENSRFVSYSLSLLYILSIIIFYIPFIAWTDYFSQTLVYMLILCIPFLERLSKKINFYVLVFILITFFVSPERYYMINIAAFIQNPNGCINRRWIQKMEIGNNIKQLADSGYIFSMDNEWAVFADTKVIPGTEYHEKWMPWIIAKENKVKETYNVEPLNIIINEWIKNRLVKVVILPIDFTKGSHVGIKSSRVRELTQRKALELNEALIENYKLAAVYNYYGIEVYIPKY